jgi:hypothetical protein
MPRDHLREFAEQVRSASTDKQSERIVRIMIKEVAEDCPTEVLVQIGQCIIDFRKSELRGEAERN